MDMRFGQHVSTFDLDFQFHSNVLAVIEASDNFTTKYDGFIGIAPFTSLDEQNYE